ncbi:MAG: hypothetical protein ACPG6Y_04930 [Candidatus Puniceispirillaceae bacterium]|jgi:hypothetical protein
MTQNPSPEQMRDMIEALFAKTDEFRAQHDLDPPGDLTGFTELLRLIFSDDAAGQAIFASFDEELLTTLWDMYQKRVLVEMK